jgi:hypothetical protein
MSDGQDTQNLEPQEQGRDPDDELLSGQEGKGYGEDEGEREQALNSE